jgi:tetratricopeptide (TPR) repeat protein
MTNWERIEELFNAAIELPEAGRTEFLDRACAGQPELRREVESLLTAESEGARAIPEAVGRLAASIEPEGEGARVGPYRLLRKLGEGGMGVVYLAHRDDDEFRQEVALKLVRVRAALAVTRFRHERQILAALEHPNIARLFDGGTTAGGTPYLVMEHVRGEHITAHCEARKLDRRARLQLFLKVCAAVHHAHQRLVIHRDIKPSNILVTDEGEPKLLDFGIAKLLDGAPGAMPETQTGMQVLTPDYASAEQVRGGPVTTATDVYSLGLVLYELLTGRRAQKITSYSPEEVVRVVCETEPPKPDLKCDLDNIILMALRKEPERRYASVEQFADDVRRYLEDRPVRARSDTLGYRFGKFARRNRWGVAAAALLLLTLAGGIVATAYQARRAQRRFDEVRAIANRFLFDFEGEIRRLTGATKAREMVVRTALEYLDKLYRDSGRDASLQREIAQAMVKVGDVQGGDEDGNLGQTGPAIESWNKAIGIYRAVIPRIPDARENLAYALMRRGKAIRLTGKVTEGLEDQREAVRLLDTVGKNNQGRALAHCFLGDQLFQMTLTAEALPEMRQCLDLLRAIGKPDPTAIGRVALAMREAGKLEEARALHEEAIAAFDETMRKNPLDGKSRRELAVQSLHAAAVCAHEQFVSLGDFAGALRHSRRAFEIFSDLAAKDPQNAAVAQDLAVETVLLAFLTGFGEGKTGEAIEQVRKLIPVFERSRLANAKSLAAYQRVGTTRLTLARLLEKAGSPAEAIREAEEALRIQEDVAGANGGNFINMARLAPRIALARLYRLRGDPGRGLALLAPVAARVEGLLKETSSTTVKLTIAEYYAEHGRVAADPTWTRRAAAVYEAMKAAGVSKAVWESRLASL